MDDSMDKVYPHEYDSDLDFSCNSNTSLALKIGIGVALAAIIGSMVTLNIIRKRKETCNY